jgi:hypothetical protein
MRANVTDLRQHSRRRGQQPPTPPAPPAPPPPPDRLGVLGQLLGDHARQLLGAGTSIAAPRRLSEEARAARLAHGRKLVAARLGGESV